MAKVFIDGAAGTTGLAIRERLAGRRDLDLITLPEEVRKDPAARAEALNRADAAILCLPDAAAVEAVGLIDPANTHTAVIDTSTAHRTADGWTYGFPELAGQREKIRASKRIANPGCHASGFVALAAPPERRGGPPGGRAADRHLPHRLFRRREEDDRGVRGGGTGSPPRRAPDVRPLPDPQAPAGDEGGVPAGP